MSKLPTANEIIDENLGGLELTMDDDMWKFYKDIIRQTIESHTAAHTAGLEAKYNEAYLSAAKYAEESVRLRGRVKELEGAIAGYKECFEQFVPEDKWDEATAFLSSHGNGLAKEIQNKGL